MIVLPHQLYCNRFKIECQPPNLLFLREFFGKLGIFSRYTALCVLWRNQNHETMTISAKWRILIKKYIIHPPLDGYL